MIAFIHISRKYNFDRIVKHFENRSTKAAAESFNAKIKAFTAQFRGVRNVEYFYIVSREFMLYPQVLTLIPNEVKNRSSVNEKSPPFLKDFL